MTQVLVWRSARALRTVTAEYGISGCAIAPMVSPRPKRCLLGSPETVIGRMSRSGLRVILTAVCAFTAPVVVGEESAPATPETATATVRLPEVTYKPEVFTLKDGETEVAFKWRRPPEVHFVVISGCGAGNDGLDFTQTPSDMGLGYSGGNGGRAALPVTQLLGPLIDPIYTVTLRRGGGQATSFAAEHITISLPGGQGHLGAGRMIADRFEPTDGEPSIYGPGGKGTIQVFGNHAPGGAAPTDCAGGGGGGASNPRGGPRLGGLGGPGRLAIYPLPDLDRVFRVLAEEQPAPTQSQSLEETRTHESSALPAATAAE